MWFSSPHDPFAHIVQIDILAHDAIDLRYQSVAGVNARIANQELERDIKGFNTSARNACTPIYDSPASRKQGDNRG